MALDSLKGQRRDLVRRHRQSSFSFLRFVFNVGVVHKTEWPTGLPLKTSNIGRAIPQPAPGGNARGQGAWQRQRYQSPLREHRRMTK